MMVWTMDGWLWSFGHYYWLFTTKLIVFYVNLSFGILIFQNIFSLDPQNPISERGLCADYLIWLVFALQVLYQISQKSNFMVVSH